MRISKVFSGILGILGAMLAAATLWVSLYALNAHPVLLSQPQAAAQRADDMMDALCRGDYTAVGSMIAGSPDLGADRQPEDEVGVLIWNAFLDSIRYEFLGECYATDAGVARDVLIESMDIPSVTVNLRERSQNLLNQCVSQAEDTTQVYDENGEYRKDIVMDALYDAAKQAIDEDAVTNRQEVTLNLVYQDGTWRALGEQSVLNAISGGFGGDIMAKFDRFVTNEISDALDGVLAVPKSYWLSDKDLVAPKPNPSGFGEAQDPKELQWLLDQAADLLDGQTMYFGTETKIMPGSTIRYYYDKTILAIAWKEVHDRGAYTYSEVKIAHPSQLRRFLAGGEYGSEKQYITTEMAKSVNAVVASSGDFYKYRKHGITIYNGTVCRVSGKSIDTCFIDENGDLRFSHAGEMTDKENVQRYADENKIRFSLAFGPILIENGVRCEPRSYAIGEVNDPFSRAALCQMDSLHYLVCTVNMEKSYLYTPTIHQFAKRVQETGCKMSYTLDGGQTATIAMDGRTVNHVDYGAQRRISDIIYFATAVPDGG